MIQKPFPKNGQKHPHDAPYKTSSAEPQQQQHQHHKAERVGHVQDVAKQSSGSVSIRNGSSHGAANGHAENGRGNQSNSVASAHAPYNVQQARQIGQGNANLGSKPSNGHVGPSRPQLNAAGVQYSAPKTGSKPHGTGGSNNANANGNTPTSGVAVAHPSAMPSAALGGRGREQGGAAAAGSADCASAAGGNARHAPGQDGARAKEPRRRGGRGCGGRDAIDGVPGAAESEAVDLVGNGGQEPSVNDGVERPERSGRPRGGRRPRASLQRGPDTEGVVAGDSEPAAPGANGDRAQFGGTERGGQRSSRGRGRRGRGGQQNGATEDGEGYETAEPGQVQSRSQPQSEAMAQQVQQERKPKPQRPRAPKEEHGGPSARQDSGSAGGGSRPANREQAAADGADQGTALKPQRQRRGREPRQGPTDQQPKALAADKSERDSAEGPRGGSRGQGRGGRRRNGGGDQGATAVSGNGVEGAPSAPLELADGSAPNGGRRPRAPRPPRQLQAKPEEPPQPPPAVPVVEKPPAPPASHLQYQSSPLPVEAPPASQPIPSQPIQKPPPQQQPPEPPLQPHYQMPPFPDGQPLLDYPQQLLQHMVPPPQYHHQEYHHHQPQYGQMGAFQQFQAAHQQMLSQHMAAPAPPGPGAHNFLLGPYNAPIGPMGGPSAMPAFYPPGPDAYGQMLPPPPPAFAGAPTPPIAQPTPFEMAQVAQLGLAQVSQTSYQQEVPISPKPQQEAPREIVEPPPPASVPQQPKPTASNVLERAVKETADVKTETAEPAPVAAPAAAAPPEAPAAEPVKNEWADRLAQQALARMNAVKSSLIRGSSEGLVDERPRSSALVPAPARNTAYSNGPAQPPAPSANSPRGSYAPDADARRGYGDTDSFSRRSAGATHGVADTWRNGTGNTAAAPPPPSDAPNGWRANLAPTGAADAAEAWRTRSSSTDESDTASHQSAPQAPAPYQPPRRDESPPPPPSSGLVNGVARPRLNLQPRTKPLPTVPVAAPNAPAFQEPPPPASNLTAASRSAIFGAARPREEVLRERGVTEPERMSGSVGSFTTSASIANGPRMNSGRAGSVTSGASDEDQWHTVGKGGRSKAPPASTDIGNALLDATSDPFFTGRGTGHGVAIVGRSIPNGRVYNSKDYYGGGSYGKGSYGSHGGETYMNAYGMSRGYGNSYGHEDNEPIFKRGLPTRNEGLF